MIGEKEKIEDKPNILGKAAFKSFQIGYGTGLVAELIGGVHLPKPMQDLTNSFIEKTNIIMYPRLFLFGSIIAAASFIPAYLHFKNQGQQEIDLQEKNNQTFAERESQKKEMPNNEASLKFNR